VLLAVIVGPAAEAPFEPVPGSHWRVAGCPGECGLAAAGSAPLSHLFFQGLISAQSLITGPPSVRERFVATVARMPNGRTLPRDFKPTKVIYAILMENGKLLTPNTLFPFSQATLAHTARILSTYGVEVEVIGILTAQVS
jgi:uncharacterized protein (TIGR04141 family)